MRMDSPDAGCNGWLFPVGSFRHWLEQRAFEVISRQVVFGSELDMSAAGPSMCRGVGAVILGGIMHGPCTMHGALRESLDGAGPRGIGVEL